MFSVLLQKWLKSGQILCVRPRLSGFVTLKPQLILEMNSSYD